MRESIAQISEIIGFAAVIVMFCAFTVEAIAKEQAFRAAVLSPFMVFLLIPAVFSIAVYFGWIKP